MDLTTWASIATILAVPIAIATFLQGRRKKTLKQIEVPVPPATPESESRVFPASQRMRHVIELMNAGRREPWTIAHFAERLKLAKQGDLEQYLNSSTEPTFDLLESFGSLTGASLDWLKFGKGQPFNSSEHNDLYADACLTRIRELAPKQTFIVRCRDKCGRSAFLLRVGEFRYVMFTRYWHISREVGGTGQGQIVSFYRAMKALSTGDSRDYGYPCGQIVDTEVFDKLLSGSVYPGTLIQQFNNPWWEDFLTSITKMPVRRITVTTMDLNS